MNDEREWCTREEVEKHQMHMNTAMAYVHDEPTRQWEYLLRLADEINTTWATRPPNSALEAPEGEWSVFNDKIELTRFIRGKPTQLPLTDIGGRTVSFIDDQSSC